MTKNPSLIFPDGFTRIAPAPGYQGNRKLYVVCCVSNPLRYKTRYELYKKFAQHIEDSGAILYTVEMAFGDRPHVLTSKDNPRHIQVRSYFELWHKENMLGLGIQQLPDDWEYVAWIDADVMFNRPDWVAETIEQLQHYMFVQMFSQAQDLSPHYESGKIHTGFIYEWQNNANFSAGGKYTKGHPGYAWAARREALDAVGGLIDWAILGSADRHMAGALIGQTELTYDPDVHPNYKHLAAEWQRRADKHIKRDVGFVSGLISHFYHGPKAKRGYMSRWKTLVKNNYNPIDDIYRDTQGLWQLEDDKLALRDAIRRYFRSRYEDDTSEGMTRPLA